MRALQISKFYPPVMGGIESVAFELTEGLNRLGIRTDVLCAHTAVKTLREHNASGYRVVRAGSLGKLLSTSMSPAMLLEARRMCRDYDVVHVQMPDPMAALALWFARPSARVVLHWQSDVVIQRRALKLYAPLQEWLLRRADAVIATSSQYAEASAELQRWRPKVEVIPIGISLPELGRAPVREAAIEDQAAILKLRYGGRRIVFSLGRMTYYKGFDVLIDAVRDLPDDVVVLVGGSGELLQSYRESVLSKGLVGRIEFVGRIADGDTPAYFKAAEAFCLASIVRAEAFGVVLLEAMAAGLPIVTTEIPGSGVPWVNQHGVTGMNVPIGDAPALADALNSLLADRHRARVMGEAGRQRFLQHFTASKMVCATAGLYGRLLGKQAA